MRRIRLRLVSSSFGLLLLAAALVPVVGSK
jgi:hypothetical protein